MPHSLEPYPLSFPSRSMFRKLAAAMLQIGLRALSLNRPTISIRKPAFTCDSSFSYRNALPLLCSSVFVCEFSGHFLVSERAQSSTFLIEIRLSGERPIAACHLAPGVDRIQLGQSFNEVMQL